MFEIGFFSIAALAVVFAGISKGGFGSGAAFAAAAILATIIEPGQAIGIMLPLLMLMDVTSLKPYWKKWLNRESVILILGSLPGVALGAWLYSRTNADVFRILIGVIALGFVLWQLAQRTGVLKQAKHHMPDGAGLIAGALAGFTSFVSHAGGPPAAVYLLSKRPNKTEFQATTVIIFWAINLAKAVPYAFLGLFTLETLTLNVALAPFALIGVWIGVKAHHWVSDRLFFALTYALLTVTGLRLIWMAVT
jgi:uncharacterized membrane protein YfcA